MISGSKRQAGYEEQKLPWSYRNKVLGFLKPETQLMYMGTGDVNFLLSLRHPYNLTSVLEESEKGFSKSAERLTRLGMEVQSSQDSAKLPFKSEAFDLIINYHRAYNLSEIYRVLKPNGFFITQQTGGKDCTSLYEKLRLLCSSASPDFNLENQLPKFVESGFRIMYSNQSYPKIRFYDVPEVFSAGCDDIKIPADICFSKDECLKLLQEKIDNNGFFETEKHRFIVIAKKMKV